MVDLAVAVIIGAAFGAVVTALVEDLITPLIASIGGQPDFSALVFTVNGSEFKIGHFLNALLSRARRTPPEDPTTKNCTECLSEIPLDAARSTRSQPRSTTGVTSRHLAGPWTVFGGAP